MYSQGIHGLLMRAIAGNRQRAQHKGLITWKVKYCPGLLRDLPECQVGNRVEALVEIAVLRLKLFDVLLLLSDGLLLVFLTLLPLSKVLPLFLFRSFLCNVHAVSSFFSILASDVSYSGSLAKPPSSRAHLLRREFFSRCAFMPYAAVLDRIVGIIQGRRVQQIIVVKQADVVDLHRGNSNPDRGRRRAW